MENLFDKSGLSFDEFSNKLSISNTSLINLFDANKGNELSKNEKVKIVENQVNETIKQLSELLQKDGIMPTQAKEIAENGIANAIKLQKINLSNKSDLNIIKKEIEKIILENRNFKPNNFVQLSEDIISNLQEANIRLESNKAEKSSEKTLQKPKTF